MIKWYKDPGILFGKAIYRLNVYVKIHDMVVISTRKTMKNNHDQSKWRSIKTFVFVVAWIVPQRAVLIFLELFSHAFENCVSVWLYHVVVLLKFLYIVISLVSLLCSCPRCCKTFIFWGWNPSNFGYDIVFLNIVICNEMRSTELKYSCLRSRILQLSNWMPWLSAA